MIGPAELARRLGLPEPTAEQAAVIAAPLSPGVVVAGAGSGKTETMAARVVWLVANGFVQPEQVLGLTFTRKAARELAGRLRRRLAQLAARGLIDGPMDGEPTVLTYDAYAGRIVADGAPLLGREPGARLITEAVAWQYAQRVVESYAGDMDDVPYAPATVVAKVLALHQELAGHLVSPTRVREFTDDLRGRVEALPTGKGQRTRDLMYADVVEMLATQSARVALLPLVEEFRARKRADGVLDFADQAELAATLADRFPDVVRTQRDTYRVVLLDEYQDTNHAQLVLLRALFADGHPVTAVGDPCQSIYGWRGASAGTLASFRREFGAVGAAFGVRLDSLTTSFRNGARILDVANRLSRPLRSEGLDVPELSALPGRPSGTVVAALHVTADDEAADVARRAREFWDRSPAGRTIAVLVRARSQIVRLEAALRAVDLPVEVVGVGGLLTTPEVADIVATLRVLDDPARGDALMRLLTGARWRLGPRDLDALARLARSLAPAPAEQAGRRVDVGGQRDQPSIVDALEALDDAAAVRWFSPEGRRRLRAFAAELRALRARCAQPLTELVLDVERTIGLDVEVAARRGPSGRVNLDRFLEVAAEFEASERTRTAPTLSAFLAYLDAAQTAERGLAPGEVKVSGDRVQLLTVHGAKGLEWDAIFVAGLVDRVFPAGGERNRAWLGDPAELPYPLRGDGSALPACDVASAADQVQARAAVQEFTTAAAAAARLEERRLAYVAVTRARQLLVCTGYRWDDAKTAREPSEFLTEIRQACEAGAGEVAVWAGQPLDGQTNPLLERQQTWQWPYDPLGQRRPMLEDGAALVEAAMTGALPRPQRSEWDDEVRRLLAERERHARHRAVEVALPDQLSVSQVVRLAGDRNAFARALRRPVPRPPSRRARRGTAFHAWLEARWRNPGLLDVDELVAADDDATPEPDLDALRSAFAASAWADRTPVEVESPFELLLGAVVVRGRVDAVFENPDGGIEVVDWKTGPAPREPVDSAAVQLAVYRLAFAALRGVELARVTAAFHYVADNLTVRPVDLWGERELRELIDAVPLTSGGTLARLDLGDGT